jgi:hypothetical protein
MAGQVKLHAAYTPAEAEAAEAEAAEFIRRDAGVLANGLVAEAPFVEWKRGDGEPHQPS